MVARTAPAVLELLADGVPRSRAAIVVALAGRHPKDDVVRTLMRLAVTEKLVETERKYSLAPASKADLVVQFTHPAFSQRFQCLSRCRRQLRPRRG